jgi:hypothetical protein
MEEKIKIIGTRTHNLICELSPKSDSPQGVFISNSSLGQKCVYLVQFLTTKSRIAKINNRKFSKKRIQKVETINFKLHQLMGN